VDGKGRLKLDRDAIREAGRYDGRWVLIANDDSLAVGDAADAYKSLLVIGRCFRSLESVQIEMSPMFHRLHHRIEAHVEICVLALLFERIVEREVGQSWARVRLALDRLQATEYHTDSHRFFQANELSAAAGAILAALKIKPPKQVLAAEPLPLTPPGQWNHEP
jgi:hypothetical protein